MYIHKIVIARCWYAFVIDTHKGTGYGRDSFLAIKVPSVRSQAGCSVLEQGAKNTYNVNAHAQTPATRRIGTHEP